MERRRIIYALNLDAPKAGLPRFSTRTPGSLRAHSSIREAPETVQKLVVHILFLDKMIFGLIDPTQLFSTVSVKVLSFS